MKAGSDEAREGSSMDSAPREGGNRGLAIVDLVLRIFAAMGTLGSAIAMGTTNQTLPFFSQFIQFTAQYNDLPPLTFFVIANAIGCAYLVLSIPLSFFQMIRIRPPITTRIILFIFDTMALALVTAGASAAAAIVYLAHKGNANANWLAICQQFNSFCQRISGSLIGSFGAVIALMLLIVSTAIAASRRQ